MKLYISADMEGTAGVCSWEQCDPENPSEYPKYRRLMSREVRAAIDGARAAGADDILVNDSHWSMHNLLWDELPDDIRVISGSRKPLSMVQGIGSDIIGAFFTGYHGGIGVENAVLAHTYSPSVVHRVAVNGIECNEALLNAAYFGHHDVPVLLLTGDATTIAGTREQLPWVVGVAVKEAIGYYSAESMTPNAACAAIAAGAREAFAHRAAAKPFRFTPPLRLTLECAAVECADFIALIPGFTRTSGRELRFDAADYPTIFRAFIAAIRIGATAAKPA